MISVTRLTSVLTALSITSMATIAGGDMPAHQEDIDFRVREVTEDVIVWRRKSFAVASPANIGVRVLSTVAMDYLSDG